MKIMILITGLGVGGAERQVSDLADFFASQGHDVILGCMTGRVLVGPVNKKVTIKSFGMDKSPFSICKGFFEIIKIIKSFKPDVVHSHMFHANLMARLARLFSSMPCLVSTAHSTNEGGRGRMLAYRLTDRLADLSTNVSAEAVKIFEQKKAVTPGRMIAVHNGIDTKKFSVNKEVRKKIRYQLKVDGLKVFLAVGRLVDAKDYPNLLNAFSAVLKREADCRLLIAGDGPLRDQLTDFAREIGISNNVLFLGARDDVPELMNAADYFVLSSEWEGFGLVVAEAMATEKIVIATDAGGVAEVLGESGFLVPKKNTDLLTAAIIKSLDLSPEKADFLRKSARQRIISKYSIDNISNKWLNLYQDLLRRKSHIF